MSNPRPYSRASLFLAASTLAVAISAPALAQTAPAPSKDDNSTVEEVVVTGFRASLRNAQNIKKNASELVDAIVAEDIGKLPDNNISEALQRIPGVQITRNHGEGSGIAIRGLTQVKTLLNGREIYSDTGRDLSLENVPAEILAGVDVYKNPSATLPEGGLGGVVNLKTRRPFDFPGFTASATARADYFDMVKKTKPQISALISDRFDTKIGEIGILFGAAKIESAGRFDQVGVEPFNNRYNVVDFDKDGVFPGTTPPTAGSDAGDLVISPNGGGNSIEITDRDRVAFNGVVQWRPTSNLDLYLEGTYNKYDYKQSSYVVFANRGSLLPAPGAVFTFSGNSNVVTSGAYRDVVFTSNSNFFDRKADTYQIATGGTWDATSHIKFTTDLAYTGSKRDDTSGGLRIGNTDHATGTILTFDTRGDLPSLKISGFDFANKSLYSFLDSSHSKEHTEGSGFSGRLDGNFKYDNSVLQSIDLGYRYTTRDIERMQGSRSHFTGNQPASLFLDAIQPISLGNFYRNPDESQLIGSGIMGAPLDLIRDRARICKAFNDTVCDPVFSPLNTYTQSEDTQAVYGQLNLALDAGPFPITGNVGVRYVWTDLSVNGFRTSNSGSGEAIDQESKYQNFLPSFNARVGLTDKLFLRLAAAGQLTRPNFSDLSPNLNIGFTNSNATLTGRAGNPDLRPLKSKSYDASLEYYFSQSGYVYFSGFLKKVDGFVQTVTRIEPVSFPDYPAYTTAEITRPQNGDDGKIKGFEVGGQTFLDFLPKPFDGLGLQANFTRVDSSAPGPIVGTVVPLVGLSKNSYNLVAFYEKGKIRGRIAYNYRSSYVDTTSGPGSGSLPIYAKAYGILDASIGYKINEHADLTFDASNILHEEYGSYFGQEDRPRFHNLFDTRYGMALRVKY
jgi:TonB-dependent receptor